jgi:tetratricopeptide (TPR) repeat protein
MFYLCVTSGKTFKDLCPLVVPHYENPSMTKLTINQAIQQGIEAHKAGQVQEAGRLYTAILKAQPDHPDANHNMGVLAVGVGKVEQALPFFKTALEAKPAIAQFWLSYIDALIKLNQLTEAKAVLDQAKSKGAKGDAFNRLGQRLNETDKHYSLDDTFNETLETKQISILDIAIQLKENGKFTQAINFLKKKISQSPEEVDMLAVLSHCYLLTDQVEEAKLLLDKATMIAPENPLARWNTARLSLKKQKPLEALKIARDMNQKFPDDVEGMGVLGTCLRANGETDESLKVLNRAIELNPNYAEALINRGLIRLSQEKKPQALADLERAHRLKAYIKEIWDLVIGLKAELQGYSEAILLLNDMVKMDPKNYKRLANLALYNQHLKDFKASEDAYKKALAIKPDSADVHLNLGSVLKEQGKLEEAIKAFNKALAIKPDYTEAYNNMGNALKEQGKLEEAIEAYKKALAIKPDHAEAFNNMGVTLREKGKSNEAIEAYNKALAIMPNYAEAYINMGAVLQDQGKLEEAIEVYKKALDIKPDHAQAFNNMGAVLQNQGKPEEAIKAYKIALGIEPDYAEAHRNLSLLTNYKADTAQINEVQALLQRIGLNDSDRCNLLYTHAKMQEDLGNANAALDNYVAGGSLRQKLLGYKFTQDELLFAQIKKTAPQLKNVIFNIADRTSRLTPIFILGMPRSGTTLVEQIVSSHSEVTGAGELELVRQFGAELTVGLNTPDLEAVSAFRERYLTELSKVANGRTFITDKMPQNFLYIALICAAFPEAKIIHVQRNPEATCWSNFKHYFTAKGLGYSYNIADTVKYYELYKELMHFWYRCFSDQIYNIDYDKLTEDQERQTRRLIDYLELNWEDACLAPQDNERSVKTASSQQVRQKVYTGSSKAWKKYEPFLNGVFDGLQP